ncbi:MAG: SMP-30/gluconolactonase/LRE family protein [Oxalobacteraceae bacterium]|nr:MAG: SMP-30/gluconolactonase/LRE family protein [Oxalobacteraceae bacterium]
MQNDECRRIFTGGDGVGECPVWDDRSRTLMWVDITGKRIHRLDPASEVCRTYPTPGIVTSVGLCESECAIVGLRKSIVRWDLASDFQTLALVEEHLPDNRLNDARVGPDGCIWVGTMQDNLTDDGELKEATNTSGSLYRVDAAGKVESLSPRRFGICNTMAWTRDGRFVTADTTTDEIFQFDVRNGTLAAERPFGRPFGRGLPDGSALDSEGFLWNCRVGGGCIVRFSPTGDVDRVVDLPCSSPTSCTFGGENLRTLFLTSANLGLDALSRTCPDEGALFALQPGPSGALENRFQY